MPAIAGGELFAVFWRHKLFLIFCGLFGAILAVTVAKFIPHRYVANAELLVDPRDLRVLDKEVMPRAAESDSGITVVESQVQVLGSTSVLKRAIAKLGLQNDPEFNGTASNPLARLTSFFGSGSKVDPELAALQTLQQRIGVKRPERTFIIDLSVSSNDPDKSVRIADAIAAAYLEDQQEYRSSSNEGAAEALDAGLNGMKEQVNAAEEKVEAYKAAHNLGLANGKLIVEQQLSDANNQLALARADTNRLKARLDDIQNSRSMPESIPEIMASQTLINLKKQLAAVSAERARFAAQLMPKHPVMVTLTQQERDVRSQIDREVSQVLASIGHDYERAKANEDALAQNVERLQGQMNEAANAQIALRELERNLEVSRSLYEQSVARARETREQSRLNTTNARVISSAMPLPARVFPPRGVILAPVGFMAGLGFGAAMLMLSFLRNGLAGANQGASLPSKGVLKAASKRNKTGRAASLPSSQSPIGVSFDDSLARRLGAWSSGPEAAATKIALPEAPQGLVAEEAFEPAVAIAKADPQIESEAEAQIVQIEDASPEPSPSVPALIEPAESAVLAGEAICDAGEAEDAVFAKLLSRVLISDMREASRAAQSVWLREGTSAMGPLARSAAISSDTIFADHIRELHGHLFTSASEDLQPKRVVWLVSKNAVPIKPVFALAFAEACAADGKKVLIVDADVRTPGLTRLLIANGQLGAEARRGERGKIIKTADSRFDVLIMSTPDAGAVARAIENARGDYDVVVVDARADTLSPELSDDNDILFVSSNRANEPADLESSIEDLATNLPWLRGLILTAKGISTSASAAPAHAPST